MNQCDSCERRITFEEKRYVLDVAERDGRTFEERITGTSCVCPECAQKYYRRGEA